MLGFAVAAFFELTKGLDVFQQVKAYPLLTIATFVIFTTASWIPFLQGQSYNVKSGPFTPAVSISLPLGFQFAAAVLLMAVQKCVDSYFNCEVVNMYGSCIEFQGKTVAPCTCCCELCISMLLLPLPAATAVTDDMQNVLSTLHVFRVESPCLTWRPISGVSFWHDFTCNVLMCVNKVPSVKIESVSPEIGAWTKLKECLQCVRALTGCPLKLTTCCDLTRDHCSTSGESYA